MTLNGGLSNPQGIAVSEDGDHLYIVAYPSGQGAILDYWATGLQRASLVANIPGQPSDIAVSGSNLFVTRWSGHAVGKYDISTGVWNPSLVTGVIDPGGIAVTPGDGTAFCTPPPSNMVAWYPFDNDGYLHHGEYDLAQGNDAYYYWTTRWAEGKVSNALLFDGTTSYAEAPSARTSSIWASGPFSIDAWVKIGTQADYTGSRIIVDKRSGSGASLLGYSFFLWNGRLGLALNDARPFQPAYLSWTTVPADNKWHLVAVTVSRTSHTGGTWYLDGSPTWTAI